eukprot:jgi/Tetstr1/462325/TSEL_007332.t1
MAVVVVDMKQHHTHQKLLHVGNDNLCAIYSLGEEDEEFGATLQLALAPPTSPISLMRAVRLRTIVIYITVPEFDPSELHLIAHHHSLIGGTRVTDRTEQWRKTVSTASEKIRAAPSPASAEQRSSGRGAGANTIRSKPSLPGTHDSDSEWETDDETTHPSGRSH